MVIMKENGGTADQMAAIFMQFIVGVGGFWRDGKTVR